jgi:hypothetical protein
MQSGSVFGFGAHHKSRVIDPSLSIPSLLEVTGKLTSDTEALHIRVSQNEERSIATETTLADLARLVRLLQVFF